MEAREEDWVTQLFVASTHAYIFIFTDRGKVFVKKVFEIPVAPRTAKGRAIVNAAASYPMARHVADQLTVSIVPKPGQWKAALDETFGVLNRLRATSPSQAEIDQQVAIVEEALKKSVDARQTENSPSLADTYVRDVDQHDVTATRTFYLKLFQAAKASLTRPTTTGPKPSPIMFEMNRMIAELVARICAGVTVKLAV